MSVRKAVRLPIVAVALAAGLVGAQTVTAGAASAAAAPRTLYYNAGSAPAWRTQVTEAVAIWNGSVHNVQLKAGSPATITIVQFSGWPYAEPNGLGRGKVHLGQEAVDEGFDKTRIAAHELGHILGLPDNRTGRCSDLMSGHSAPTSCTNAHPSPAEAAQVDRNFGSRFATATLPAKFVDCFTAPVSASR
jgi:snapalysin